MCRTHVLIVGLAALIAFHSLPSPAAAADKNREPVIVENDFEGRESELALRLELVADLAIGEADGEDAYVLGRIMDVAVDSKDNIHVLDHGYKRVQKYDSDGGYVATISGEGSGPGEFHSPWAIAVDASDRLYITGDGKIAVFDVNGEYVEEFRHGLTSLARSICVARDASITLSGFDSVSRTIIHRFDSERAHIASFCQSYAEGKGEDIRVEQTYAGGDVDITADGVIYYTQMNPYEIRRFSSDGTLLTRIHRKNSFMHDPKVERHGESMRLWMPVTSSAIILDGVHVFNVVIVPASETESGSTIVDVFDLEGHLLATRSLGKIVSFKCRDASGRFYAVEHDEFPTVARYRVALSPPSE